MLGALLAVIVSILVRHDRPSAFQIVPLDLLVIGNSILVGPPSPHLLHADPRLVVVHPGDDADAPGNAGLLWVRVELVLAGRRAGFRADAQQFVANAGHFCPIWFLGGSGGQCDDRGECQQADR
uniref:(northern house mosquito) hypothetical protein n=1 Tax=Culex pipiens TaxID=7175 RepID=A0A8D8C769_CULPI